MFGLEKTILDHLKNDLELAVELQGTDCVCSTYWKGQEVSTIVVDVTPMIDEVVRRLK